MVNVLDSYDLPNKTKSAYNLANMFGEPMSYFLASKTNCESYYQDWITRFPADTDGNKFPASLAEQSTALAQTHDDILFALASLADSYMSYGDNEKFSAVAKGLMRGVALKESEMVVRLEVGESVGSKLTASYAFATVVMTVLMSEGVEPAFALGYRGLDENTAQQFADKFISANQTKWCLDHSAMKFPDKDMQENVYDRYFKPSADYKFGQYN